MDITQGLLAAWRDAEAAVEDTEPGTTARRQARLRADVAKTAYLTHVNDVFDVQGHHHTEPQARNDAEDGPTSS